MDPISAKLMSAAAAGASNYTVGTYYPMFAVKAIDGEGNNMPDYSVEVPFRRALSFDTSNTTELDSTETVSEIISILDTSKYTCNSDFGASGNKISGIMIRHYQSNGTLYTGGEGSFEFDNPNFNIYDDACNTAALAGPSSGNLDSVTLACGNISNASLTGLSGTPYVWLNQSSDNNSTAPTGAGWAADGGDYCFLGIGAANHGSDTDSFDRYFSGSNNTSPGLAFGISDSDGRGTGSETTPREGIARLGTTNISKPSLVTNCLVEKTGAEEAHAGHTVEGYFIVYGKYLSN